MEIEKEEIFAIGLLTIIAVIWLTMVLPVYGAIINTWPSFLAFPVYNVAYLSIMVIIGILIDHYREGSADIFDSVKYGFALFLLIPMTLANILEPPYAIMINNQVVGGSFLANASIDVFLIDVWKAIIPGIQNILWTVSYASVFGTLLVMFGAGILLIKYYFDKDGGKYLTMGILMIMAGILMAFIPFGGTFELGALYFAVYFISTIIMTLVAAFLLDVGDFIGAIKG